MFLEKLDLSEVNVLETGLKLPGNLRELDLSRSRIISGFCFYDLPVSLETLNISSTRVKDRFLKFLPKGLRHLNLSSTIITNKAFQFLPRNLVSLDVSLCNNITDAGFENLPITLEYLTLSFNQQNNITSQVTAYFQSLIYLKKIHTIDKPEHSVRKQGD
eukprot:TRINITY_DN7397_c0_g1_i1.p1 TRINITY_DN7397_c0_g1~~TRINITY_DN7397_c0_g1_i1.p1  ORF type:complete len:160 (+),score=25.71 TRINITY_DN7397_c0_g1_i1:634-1113(+)